MYFLFIHPFTLTSLLIFYAIVDILYLLYANKPTLCIPLDTKSLLTGKDSDAGKDWKQEKGVTEDEMVWRHHWLNGHEFEQTPGDVEGQGSLECCSPLGHKELDTTERLNNTKDIF